MLRITTSNYHGIYHCHKVSIRGNKVLVAEINVYPDGYKTGWHWFGSITDFHNLNVVEDIEKVPE